MYKILVAVDFSDATNELISEAMVLCKARHGRIRILHVENSAPYSYAPPDPRQSLSHQSETLEPSIHTKLQEIRNRLMAQDIEADFRKLAGPAENNILLAAKEFNAELIVIGGHQHSHLFQCLFGTRTESIIRRAPCPVLVIPSTAADA
jgi:nucleotide-binding universal stress UspA family protein